jgi:hypothetical protein
MGCNRANRKTDQLSELESPTTVLCKLFFDHVSERLCMIRKKELDHKGSFSCDGCPMDGIMRGQLKLVQEVLGLSHDHNG